jgi:hypothetical protein
MTRSVTEFQGGLACGAAQSLQAPNVRDVTKAELPRFCIADLSLMYHIPGPGELR